MSFELKYPVLLVHGMGSRDNKLIGYWGRIPNALEEIGCKIYFGNQDSNADIETNGKHLAQRIHQITQETGAEKVNIIAHSKGGLDSRYAISVLGAGDKVASLTTMSTPHHGSKTVDLLMKFPDPLISPVVIDGFISVVAALCAVRLCPAVRGYLIPSHASYEIGYRLAMEAMGLEPMLLLNMRLGEGSGCPIAFEVLSAACAVINNMATFDQAGINDDYLEEIRQGDKFTVEKKQ